MRQIYALMGGDWTSDEGVPELLELFDPAVHIDMTRRVFNAATYDGHAGLERLAEEIRDVWTQFESRPEEFLDAGDKVVVIQVRRGRAKGSGIEVEDRSGSIWTLREGKVVGLVTDLDPVEALKMAGL